MTEQMRAKIKAAIMGVMDLEVGADFYCNPNLRRSIRWRLSVLRDQLEAALVTAELLTDTPQDERPEGSR